MAYKTVNRVYQYTSSTGQGDITMDGAAVYPSFFTVDEVGFAVGDQPVALIEEGDDCEIVEVTITALSPFTFTRDTVKSSRIGGMAGTTKMSLLGTATVQFVLEADRHDQIYRGAFSLGPHFNGTISEGHSGGDATFSVKTLAGNDPSTDDPVEFIFKDGSGGYAVREVTAALSVTVTSGSTLGAASATAFRVWIVAFDDGGTVRLGVVNCVDATAGSESVLPLRDYATQSATAEGGAGGADTAQTIYAGTTIADKYICLVGFASYESGLTSGVWSTSPDALVVWSPGTPRPGERTGNISTTVHSSTFTATTTAAWTDITNYQADITPQSKCNPVMAYAHAYGIAGAGNSFGLRFALDGTGKRVGAAAGSRAQASAMGTRTSDTVSSQSMSFSALLFPRRSTSSTTKVQFYLQGDTFYLNRSSADTDANTVLRAASDLILEEIMG